MAKQIFYAFTCDVYKSHESEKLIFIGTSHQKLKMLLSEKIERGEIEYYNSEIPAKKQAEIFRHDFGIKTRNYLNDNLNYAYFDYTYNNEEM